MTNDDALALLKLATELWPKWRVTKGIADLFVDEFIEVDREAAEQAIRKHRLERSTVPDLRAMVDGARSLQRSREQASTQNLKERAADFSEKVWRHRLKQCEKDSTPEQWAHAWRYCREFAYHTPNMPYQRKAKWPPHWKSPAPSPDEWPSEVVWAFSVAAEKLGWWSPHEKRKSS